MDDTGTPGCVTNLARCSTGDVDRNGDIVGGLVELTRGGRPHVHCSGPFELRYVERVGLDERLTSAGADPAQRASVRRLLGVGGW